MQETIRKLPAIYILIIVLFLIQCARPGMPSGGLKDEQPPQILKYEPDNYSANFTFDKFEIDFDEFIELDNINQKLLISPPMNELPDFKAKGKTLVVKFKEELKENTTYSIFFGDAVVDITEKNPLKENTYIFSTGDNVDSMSMEGKVINAIDLQPVEEVFVMLYKKNSNSILLDDDNKNTIPVDSLPLTVKPFYLSKTDENGQFRFNGLANEEYFIFALKDQNSNYIYDQPTEEIAFLDSLVRPVFTGLPKTSGVDSLDVITGDSIAIDSASIITVDSLDLIISDSLMPAHDSTSIDSLNKKKQPLKKYDLVLFKDRDSTQRMLKGGLLRRNTLEFSFSLPANKLELIPSNYLSDSSWYLEKFSKRYDTITWYFKNIPIDTLELAIMNDADTLEYLYISLNTDSQLARARAKKKKDEEEKKIFLEWSSNTTKGNLLLNQSPEIRFDQPLQSFNTSTGSLIIGEDTTYQPHAIIIDSFKMLIKLPIELAEATKYSYYFPDSTFIDWNGYFNKEIRLNFSTKTPADYGKMTMMLAPEKKQPYIFQMLNSQGDLMKESYFTSDTIVNYEYISPAKYKFKIVFDDNGNRKWDSGYYPDKIQPEKILFYNKEVDVRANWEIEESWIIK